MQPTFVMFCPQCGRNTTFSREPECQSCGYIPPRFRPKEPFDRPARRHAPDIVGLRVEDALDEARQWMSDNVGEDGLQ